MMLAVCAMLTCFFTPIATFTGVSNLRQTVNGELRLIPHDNPDMTNQILYYDKVDIEQRGFLSVWPLTVLTIVVAAITQAALFFYKKRRLQMKMLAFAFLFCVLDIFLIFIWAVDDLVDGVTVAMELDEVGITYHVGTWCTVACAVFLFLAQRYVKKDEELVRSTDRLR